MDARSSPPTVMSTFTVHNKYKLTCTHRYTGLGINDGRNAFLSNINIAGKLKTPRTVTAALPRSRFDTCRGLPSKRFLQAINATKEGTRIKQLNVINFAWSNRDYKWLFELNVEVIPQRNNRLTKDSHAVKLNEYIRMHTVLKKNWWEIQLTSTSAKVGHSTIEGLTAQNVQTSITLTSK